MSGTRGRALRVVVEADGGARGNPGPAGWGAVVREADTGEILQERAEAIGTATNNVAEYGGLIAGLQAAAELGATSVEVRMDSKLVIEQMAGRWKIKHPGLRPLAADAAGLVRQFDAVTWTWIPRERNRDADRLANQAMDAAAKGQKRVVANAAPTTPRPAPSAGRHPPGPATTPATVRVSWDPAGAPPTRLLLVRHGDTPLTAERRYAGRGDVPLSALGTTQAEALARRVAALVAGGGEGSDGAAGPGDRVTAVVSSPLARCTATATTIAAAVGDPPVVSEPDLIECDFGEWEGYTLAEIQSRWPDESAAWLAGTGAAPPGGESLQQVAKRVRRAVSTLRESYPATTVVVVSHVWPLKIMLRDALAAGDAFLHRLFLSAAGISMIDSYPDGAIAVRTVNDTSHLLPPD